MTRIGSVLIGLILDQAMLKSQITTKSRTIGDHYD